MDYSGETINGITILSKSSEKTKGGDFVYKMKCHCGKEFKTSYRNNIKSCGCLSVRDINHSGEIINGVEVLSKLKNKNTRGQTLYKMKCHCGFQFYSEYDENIKNCGCKDK